MKWIQFEMERLQSTWENRVRFNLSESSVHPMSARELIPDPEFLSGLLDTPLIYNQSNGTDELRATLMPVNTKFPLDAVIARAAQFSRRVTFEYVMLGGVNDADEHAAALAALAHRCGAFVNLIPLHPGGAMGFIPSPPDRIARFASRLKAARVEVAVRRSRGLDISAACGQLRAERLRRRPPARADEDRQVNQAP